MSDEVRETIARREQAAEPVADVLVGYLGRAGASQMSAGARALMAWRQVNGDVERAHTAGVYVAAPRRQGQLPELTVYVDSNAYVTDFSANREVYLARLETAGLRFSKIVFRRSKYPAVSRETPSRPETPTARPLAPLDPADAAQIEQMCSELPDSLRESVSGAMRVSYQRSYEE